MEEAWALALDGQDSNPGVSLTTGQPWTNGFTSQSSSFPGYKRHTTISTTQGCLGDEMMHLVFPHVIRVHRGLVSPFPCSYEQQSQVLQWGRVIAIHLPAYISLR